MPLCLCLLPPPLLTPHSHAKGPASALEESNESRNGFVFRQRILCVFSCDKSVTAATLDRNGLLDLLDKSRAAESKKGNEE